MFVAVPFTKMFASKIWGSDEMILGRRRAQKHTRLLLKRWSSVDYLLKTLPQRESRKSEETATKLTIKLPPKDLTRLLITPRQLTAKFWPTSYAYPNPKDLKSTPGLFLRAQFKLEWTLANYDEIPDVRYQRLQEEYVSNVKANLHSGPQKRKSHGIEPQLLQPLPEILLLGHTNVGKSSLVNNLFGAGSGKLAYVSRQPGYTQTMNCYNIGKKFRLIDSPGYGERGDEKQGQMVLEYLERRRVLRQVYVLVDGSQGLFPEDTQMLEHLIDGGHAFDIVFTKVDQVIDRFVAKLPSKVKDSMKKEKALAPKTRLEYAEQITATNEAIEAYFLSMIQSAGLDELVTLPRIYFNNAYKSVYVKQTYGYKELRYAMCQ